MEVVVQSSNASLVAQLFCIYSTCWFNRPFLSSWTWKMMFSVIIAVCIYFLYAWTLAVAASKQLTHRDSKMARCSQRLLEHLLLKSEVAHSEVLKSQSVCGRQTCDLDVRGTNSNHRSSLKDIWCDILQRLTYLTHVEGKCLVVVYCSSHHCCLRGGSHPHVSPLLLFRVARPPWTGEGGGVGVGVGRVEGGGVELLLDLLFWSGKSRMTDSTESRKTGKESLFPFFYYTQALRPVHTGILQIFWSVKKRKI